MSAVQQVSGLSSTLSKKVLQASELDSTPREGDQVSCNICSDLVFYILTLYKEGNPVGSPIATTKSPARLVFGTGEIDPHFERCLALCRLGERSEFELLGSDPSFKKLAVWNGFDNLITDRAGFVAHPDNYLIKLELEICEIKPSRTSQVEELSIFELSTEQKAAKADSIKKQADDEFKAGNLAKAIELYTSAFKTIYFEDGVRFTDLKLKIGSNLAFANLKVKKFEDCINMNDQFIRFGYDVTEKNYYRNGMAAENYGRLEEAQKFYERAIEVSNDPEFKKSTETNITTIKKKIVDKKDQVRKNMQKMWNS